MSNYMEPRLRRDFGGIVTAFFNFLKGNIKGLINVFVGYNGIFFILFLISTYFLITGFVEYLIIENAGFYSDNFVDQGYASMLIGGSIIFLFLFIAVASILNYSIASSYLSLYEIHKQNDIPKKTVWRKAKQAFWGVFLLAICAGVMYVVYVIVQLVLGFIPVLGTIASLIIGLGFNAWISLAIFSYVHNDDFNVFDAFGDAWTLLFSGFWKSIGVNFVLGFLVQICLFALTIAPAIIGGVIIFHAVENSGDFTESTFSHIVLVIIITIFCIMIMFFQMISQIINGLLYFNLHEFKHNIYLRQRVEQLGSR